MNKRSAPPPPLVLPIKTKLFLTSVPSALTFRKLANTLNKENKLSLIFTCVT